MFGGTGKRGFARTRVSPAEQAISWLLLALVAAVGWAVYEAGQTYDPALFGLDVEELPRPSATHPQVAPAGAAARAEADDVGAAIRAAAPAGWQPQGKLERFTADNLYVKIDGRAEQYEAYDVVGLTCQTLAPVAGGARYIDVYVYDMRTVPGAFGIYSVERPPDEPSVAVGRGGFQSGASIFCWHGQYYVQVMASEAGAEMAAASLEVAEGLARRLSDDGLPVPDLDLLPRRDLLPGSVQFLMRDALSLEFLTHTFVGQYRAGDGEITGFATRQTSAAAADTVLSQYRDYLAEFGQVRTEERREGDWVYGDLDGLYDVVFRRGDVVAGVTLADDAALAEAVAGHMWQEIGTRVSGRAQTGDSR